MMKMVKKILFVSWEIGPEFLGAGMTIWFILAILDQLVAAAPH